MGTFKLVTNFNGFYAGESVKVDDGFDHVMIRKGHEPVKAVVKAPLNKAIQKSPKNKMIGKAPKNK